MLDPKGIYTGIRACGVNFFAGVPDSLLKEFCACITDLAAEGEHIIAANEGGSIGLATGHYIATGKPALVYMQNSGLGNAINPLLSLADPGVYAIPMLLLIGWRGEPGVNDEPQHVRQGEVTLPMLEALGISYEILPDNTEEAIRCLRRAYACAFDESRPVAVIVRKGAFGKYDTGTSNPHVSGLFTREEALEIILKGLGDDDALVATTGKTSREVFELRERHDGGRHRQDFLTVGSMGHCSQIALGMALAQPERRVWCLDGDGAALMHMGGMAIVGQSKARNLVHIVLNNGVHESVGGQPTVARGIDVVRFGEAMGYQSVLRCEKKAALAEVVNSLGGMPGPVLIEVLIAPGSRDDLGRPTLSPGENKKALMSFLKS